MTAIVSKHGELLFIIQADEQTIELNTFDDCIAAEDPPASNMFYENGWVDMPDQPSQNHIFNYEARQWFDPRSVEQIKEQKWSEIKSQRDQLEFGGFEFEGNIYDSDKVSQGRILGASIAGVDQVWTLADNTTVNLTAEQLVQLYQALQIHIAIAHERGRTAREAIMSATTKEDVESITL
ncbi:MULTISPECIES: DUF4376 domain-containing protein [Acinetobacter calcoaceticus/baumannii complex]|uniref:DUF4376 domain-containing protein n=1 Tax=Acinetobacter calcoaceticus/baumannii complex TaxID=909768 RepID=UPI000DE67E11|nr:DUF4376 domain-containing protein [Acinetobacter baumannii]SSQ04237.1 Uncharacterised protein [Acinetobacter baumannii]